jgi:hypothetical protein
MLRYNRVEGLSAGAAASLPLDPTTTFTLEARVGTGDREPNVAATLERGPEGGRWTLSGFHRLQSMADDDRPFSFTNSLGNLLFGLDRGEYYRATGASLGYRSMGSNVRWSMEAFHERQRPVRSTTDFFLLQSVRDVTPDSVLAASPLDESGGRLALSWFVGVDPNALILTGRANLEAAGGDATYQRASASMSASHPLPLGLAGALEIGGGALWGDEPLQRQFFLGGSGSLRGFDTNAEHGVSYWRGRAELATGFAGARIGLFGDAGWVGPRNAFTLNDPLVAVGVGTSLLDGLLRADLARAVRGGSGWKVHLYLDGLF